MVNIAVNQKVGKSSSSKTAGIVAGPSHDLWLSLCHESVPEMETPAPHQHVPPVASHATQMVFADDCTDDIALTCHPPAVPHPAAAALVPGASAQREDPQERD